MWRDWSWGLVVTGRTSFRLDPVEASLHLAGEVWSVPVAEALQLSAVRGYLQVLCPKCERRLGKDGLLVAVVVERVSFGCTRCYPPPKDAPHPGEVRRALEALANRPAVSASR